MPQCVVCGGRFTRGGGWYAEPDPCECGAMLTEDAKQEMGPDAWERFLFLAALEENGTDDTDDDT